jgi:pimeloyl-ACP methyl ester carboxylesterase
MRLANTVSFKAMSLSHQLTTHYLTRPEGRIAYDDEGDGALVVLVPGMGDPRSTFRFQTAVLRDAGYRVVSMDLRGHGESDTTFTSYDDESLAADIIALVESLGAPSAVVGNSMGAGAAVIAAAQRPELFTRLGLIGAFVRNPPMNKATLAMFRVLIARPWARQVWKWYLPKLYAGRKPADFDAYRREVVETMGRAGRTRAFVRTTHTTHAPAEAAAPSVKTPVLIVMGALDPDFADPIAEAAWIADTVHGDVVIVDDAGHYPHSQQPAVVNSALLDFLGQESTNA